MHGRRCLLILIFVPPTVLRLENAGARVEYSWRRATILHLRRVTFLGLGMHMVSKRGLLLLAVAACLAAPFKRGRLQAREMQDEPMATRERILSPDWWPTKRTPQRDEYLGPAVCAQCHSAEAAAQETTPMAKACVVARDSKALGTHPKMGFHLGPYVYSVTRAGNDSIFSVSDGAHRFAAPLGWAFGEGETGVTFVFAQGGIYYEARLSYFPSIDGLDITRGNPLPYRQVWKRPLAVPWIRKGLACASGATTRPPRRAANSTPGASSRGLPARPATVPGRSTWPQ